MMNDSSPLKYRNIYTLYEGKNKEVKVKFNLSEIYLACRDLGFRYLKNKVWVKIDGDTYKQIHFNEIKNTFGSELRSFLEKYNPLDKKDETILNEYYNLVPLIRENNTLKIILEPHDIEMKKEYLAHLPQK